MNHDLEVSIISELLDQIETNRNADAGRQALNPASTYISTDVARQEWEQFFRRHPQLVALSGDLPVPGSHLTIDELDAPIVVTRADDGDVHAFVNACRHRGTRVVEGRGVSRVLTCPFHHWSYANTGELVGIPRIHDFGQVDRACRSLIPLPVRERHGQIWVHPDPDGILDLDGLIGQLGPELDEWGLGQLVFAGETVIDGALNWKLAVDTFCETYHVDRLHRDTLASLIHSDTLVHQPFGPHHRMAFALRGIEQWRDRPEAEWTLDGTVNVIYFLFPNVQLNVNGGSAALIRIYPDRHDPGRSRTIVSHYFSADSGPEALPMVQDIFDRAIEHEDYVTAETAQRALASGVVDDLLFGRNEPALHHVHNAYRAALGIEPLASPEN